MLQQNLQLYLFQLEQMGPLQLHIIVVEQLDNMNTSSLDKEAWLKSRKYILEALNRGIDSHSEKDVFYAIARGDAQLWTGQQSACVTEIVTYPNYKMIRFWLGGGNLEELKEMEKPICEWAKSIGCEKSMILGRKGWSKIKHENRTYKEVGTISIRSLL